METEEDVGLDAPGDRAMLVTKFLKKQRGGAMRREDARNLLRRTLESHTDRRGLVIYAWAFLPSKVVLLVKLPTAIPLAVSLGEVFGYYTRRFNARYRRSGAVFRTRFLKKVLLGEEEIERAIAHIHAQPADAEMREHPGAEPCSSRAAYVGAMDGITTLYVPASPQRGVSTASNGAPFAPLNFVDAENAGEGSAGMVTER